MVHQSIYCQLPAIVFCRTCWVGQLVWWRHRVCVMTEQEERAPSRDRVFDQACKTDINSSGLPVGVQVLAPAWREDVVLAVMGLLENAFEQTADYPRLSLPLTFAAEDSSGN